MDRAIRLSILVGGAFAAWGLWLAEVRWVKGWEGLAWLSGFNWSALPICALIVVVASYVTPARASRPDRRVFIGVGWVLAIAAFAVARRATFELFSGSAMGRAGLGPAAVLLIAGAAVSAGLALSASRWLAPLRRWAGVLVAVGLALVLPLSVATIRLLPALNGSTDQIHSIKMGYPVFWTAVLVPLALRLGRRAGRGPGAR